jgi:hypothetical protein
MTLRLTDRIVAPSRGSIDEAMAYAKSKKAQRQDFLRDYLTELWRLCKANGFDFSILVAQSAHETGNWAGTGFANNTNWTRLGNPAGLAITNSENRSVNYQSGTDAARAHVVHMWAYRYGRVPKGSELEQYTALDGHYNEVFSTNDTRGNPLAGSVRTLGDFNVNGRWALLDRANTPKGPLDDYGNRIVQDGRAVWPNLPDQDPPVTTPSTPDEPVEQEPPPVVDTSKLVTGRVPHPLFVDAIVSKPNVQSGYGYDTVAPRKNVGCCWHEWQGSGNEKIDFVKKFFGPSGERYTNALVDYAIMRDSAGTIVRLNNPRGTRSPWASGGGVESGGLEGDGPAFYNKFGIGAINAKLVSTEIVKSDSQNYTEAQIESAARLAAYWHDQDGQYYFEHPYTTKYGIVTSFLHFEFGTTSCGLGELDDITKVQARTRAIMEQYQTGATEPLPDNPPDVPPLPELDLPGGISLAKAKERFGTLRKIDAKVGTSTLLGTYGFDPKGVISLGWANKCAEVFGTAYDRWPAAGDWIVFQEPIDKNTNDLITFDGWDQNMIRKNERQGFVWV